MLIVARFLEHRPVPGHPVGAALFSRSVPPNRHLDGELQPKRRA
jgi:hypothetical protein